MCDKSRCGQIELEAVHVGEALAGQDIGSERQRPTTADRAREGVVSHAGSG